MHSRPNSGIFTARKRRSGKGNVFAPVCHSVHRGGSLYDVTSYLAAWSKFLQGVSVPGPMFFLGISVPGPIFPPQWSPSGGGLYEGGLCEGVGGSM